MQLRRGQSLVESRHRRPFFAAWKRRAYFEASSKHLFMNLEEMGADSPVASETLVHLL